MEAVTITFPAIPTQEIAALTETEQILAMAELEFVSAVREKYAPLAHLNGNIRTSTYRIGDDNWSESGDTYLHGDGGKLVKGLLAADYFAEPCDSQYAGRYTGNRLYLTADGWVEITRAGHWSRWQGGANYWTVDGDFADGKEFNSPGGGIRWLSDDQVAAEFDIKDLAEQMAKTLSVLATKIPERMSRKKALAESLRSAIGQISK